MSQHLGGNLRFEAIRCISALILLLFVMSVSTMLRSDLSGAKRFFLLVRIAVGRWFLAVLVKRNPNAHSRG